MPLLKGRSRSPRSYKDIWTDSMAENDTISHRPFEILIDYFT